MTAPAPSPRPYPSAFAEKVLQRPSGASAPAADMARYTVGVMMTLTPPTMARPASPARSAWQARWTAASDEEHAVSTARLGPRTPRKYDRRPGVPLKALPVP